MDDTSSTLLAIIPLIIILTALAAAAFLLPRGNFDIRDKAAEPIPTLAPQIVPNYQTSPETACSELYSPVCGEDGTTYSSECDASLAGVNVVYTGTCTTLKTSTPSASPTY